MYSWLSSKEDNLLKYRATGQYRNLHALGRWQISAYFLTTVTHHWSKWEVKTEDSQELSELEERAAAITVALLLVFILKDEKSHIFVIVWHLEYCTY